MGRKEKREELFSFSAEEKAAFRDIVIRHASQLDVQYIESICAAKGRSILEPQESGGALLVAATLCDGKSLDEWVQNDLLESDLPLDIWLSVGQAEVVGHIGRSPVYFIRSSGMYGYAAENDRRCMLELWLSFPCYPPRW